MTSLSATCEPSYNACSALALDGGFLCAWPPFSSWLPESLDEAEEGLLAPPCSSLGYITGGFEAEVDCFCHCITALLDSKLGDCRGLPQGGELTLDNLK